VTLHITTATTGGSFPRGYGVCVDPYPDPSDFGYLCTTSGTVGVNSDVSLSVGRGSHVVDLDAAANCTVSDGSSRTVDVGATTEVSFAITCVPAGAVRITMVSTGNDVPDAYVVCFDPSTTSCGGAVVGANGTVTVSEMTAGPHTVTVTGVARNCTMSGSTTRAVTVTQDDTANVVFDVGCVVVERIAFAYSGMIVVRRLDAADSPPHGAIAGFAPAWSPDGARLAYECGQDICAINADWTGFARLTMNGAGNHHPTWSPDGSKIAFAATQGSATDLYVMAANGSGAARRTHGVGFLGSPAWSPDGTTIAFDCRVDAGNDDICSVNIDGTGFARLTNDPARDYGAAWKPDGSTLAFATTRYGADEIVLMGANGSGVARIGAGLSGFAPTWSLDATQLAFVQLLQVCGVWDFDCDSYTTTVISTANADGSDVRTLTPGDQPVWKPHP
jgi:hypothetical protein